MDERVTPDVALGELARLERRGDIIDLATVQGRGDTYIRRESWEQEKTVLRHIAEGKNSLPPLVAKHNTLREITRARAWWKGGLPV